MTDDEPLARAPAHVIGQSLDAMSLREFEERLALLRGEILRLEAARERKRAALDAAGSIFDVR